MHKPFLLSILLVHGICSCMAKPQDPVAEKARQEETENLQRWYTRAKIMGVVTLSVVAVLAYKRLGKSLDNLETFAAHMQPGIENATAALEHIKVSARALRKNIQHIQPALNDTKATLKTIRIATRGVHQTLERWRPALAQFPRATRHLQLALKKTNLTMKQIHATARSARSITGKVDALINPHVILTPQIQQAIQATTASVATGLASAPSTVPAWTPKNVLGAVAKNPKIIATAVTSAIRAFRAPVPGAAKSWRWFGWFRK